jgi:hypothetical protein
LRGDLKAETGSVIIAAQDQALHTKYSAPKILQANRSRQQMKTQQIDERIHVGHILSACPLLAKERYIEKHERMCAQLHFNICKEVRVRLGSERWNEHVQNL